MRLLIEAVLYGEPDYGGDWRHKLKIPGIAVTDARSLYDHLITTGSIPKERQTLIDLLVARDLIENGAMKLKWVPTTHMLSDSFTKSMTPGVVMQKFLTEWKYALTPTEGEEATEDHMKSLRQGQRQRTKERKKQAIELAKAKH